MYTTINYNPPIEFDEDIISKIKEMIEKGLNKLKSFVKSKTNSNLNFYNELNCEFDEIVSKLEELELWEERRYFLAVEDMVLYIVHENSLDDHFGHYNFAVEVLNFYVELFKANLEFYANDVSVDDEKFKRHQESYKKEYHNYRRTFYQTIYVPSGNHTDEELYEILKGWKE